MQSVINIPDEMYSEIEKYDGKHDVFIDRATLYEAICNGIALDGLANGEVMQKMFPQMEIISANPFSVYVEMKECNQFNDIVSFDVDWWNRKWGE